MKKAQIMKITAANTQSEQTAELRLPLSPLRFLCKWPQGLVKGKRRRANSTVQIRPEWLDRCSPLPQPYWRSPRPLTFSLTPLWRDEDRSEWFRAKVLQKVTLIWNECLWMYVAFISWHIYFIHHSLLPSPSPSRWLNLDISLSLSV